MKRTTLRLLLSLVLASAACTSDPTPADGTNPPTGSAACVVETLRVEISGLPDGVKADVAVVQGATPTVETVTASGTVAIADGTWTLNLRPVTIPDPSVRTVYLARTEGGADCDPATKTTTVRVVYERVPTSQHLWTTTSNVEKEVLGFASASLQTTASRPADVTADVSIPGELAFDREGGLWTVQRKGGPVTLVRYPASVVAAGGELVADIEITSEALNFGAPSVGAIAFDQLGDLYLSAPAAGKVIRFALSDLETSGAKEPVDVITDVKGPGALAFDMTGAVWVAERDESRILKFELGASGGLTPATASVAITAETPPPVVTPHQSPSGMAFDASGNLFVNFNGGAIVRFTPDDLAASGNKVPSVQVGLAVDVLAEGLAFDEGGGLWLGYGNGKLARLAATQLAASGTAVVPEVILTSASIGASGSIALYPAPAGLPIHSSLP